MFDRKQNEKSVVLDPSADIYTCKQADLKTLENSLTLSSGKQGRHE